MRTRGGGKSRLEVIVCTRHCLLPCVASDPRGCTIQGDFIDPGPWTLEGATSIGVLLRQLHNVTASFHILADAVWYPWFGRGLGVAGVIGHCDVAP
jgi:hypothetical protein